MGWHDRAKVIWSGRLGDLGRRCEDTRFDELSTANVNNVAIVWKSRALAGGEKRRRVIAKSDSEYGVRRLDIRRQGA